MVELSTQKIIDRLKSESHYRSVFLMTLEYCLEPKSLDQVRSEILRCLEAHMSVLPPETFLVWMEQDGAIRQVGTLQNRGWQTTEAGNEILLLEAPNKKLAELLQTNIERRAIFLDVLDFCKTPRQRSEVEDCIDAHLREKELELHPIFFIQQLEKIGALEWTEKRWRTTRQVSGIYSNTALKSE